MVETLLKRQSRSAIQDTFTDCSTTLESSETESILRWIATQQTIEQLETVFGGVVVQRMRVVTHVTDVRVRLLVSGAAKR